MILLRVALILLLFPAIALTDAGMVGEEGQTVASGGGCSTTATVDTMESYELNSNFVGDTTNNGFVGQWAYNFPQAGKVCKIEFKLRYRGTGSITGITYNAQIRELDGNGYTLSTVMGESDDVAGVDTWNKTIVAFDFSTSVTVDTTTDVNFLLTSDTIGAAYISMYGTENDELNSTGRAWKTDLSSNGGKNDMQVRIYYED